jgi:Universal stress protein UspA and related nucleotide-binding proteins
MKRILLPTDFSKNAWNAILYATNLFKNEECDFYILNVYSVIGFASDNMLVPEIGEIAYSKVKEASEKGLNKTLFKLSFREENPKHEFFILSRINTLIQSIKEVVDEKEIDMIFMGTKGATNSNDFFFGSNTVRVMEKVRNCPVMAIPTIDSYDAPKEIVFPTGFKTHYKKRELQHLIDILKLNNASLRILHVKKEEELDDIQENNRRMLVDYFTDIEHSFHYLKEVNILDGLNDFVKLRDSNMIAFINKEHGFFENLFSKPMVKELGYHSSIPVLALHDLKN